MRLRRGEGGPLPPHVTKHGCAGFKWIIWAALILHTDAVDLHFENADSGFFLRPETGASASTARATSDGTILERLANSGGILDVERFTVLDATRPALIRAKYGPFSTKQTVPARYVMPQYPEEENITLTPGIFTTPQLEVSAHLVAKKITRVQPTIRVLLHGAGARGHHSPHVCVTVIIRRKDQRISGSCTPVGAGETGGDATCLVTLRVPSRWWPPHTRTTVKIPRTTATVSYMVGTAEGPEQCASFSHPHEEVDDNSYLGIGPRVTVQPETPVGEVLLGLEEFGYEEISKDPLVQVQIPKAPMHPGTTMHASVYLNPSGNLPAIMLQMKCRVRGGLRIANVEASSSVWNVTYDISAPKRNKASVFAILTDMSPNNETLHNIGLNEVMSWAFEVPSDSQAGESRITWTIQYVMDAQRGETFSKPENPRKISAKVLILKDDIQAVLPIAKSWSIVNSAVLTGRQVSRAMKVLIVSQAGKVADVTLQSSCRCTEETALKVSASCTSVYLDGSEVLGSHNATVVARYGQRTGSASFTVWMPELPLLLHVDDAKLSHMRGWKAPVSRPPGHPFVSKSHGGHPQTLIEESDCEIRYQQTPIQVYGRFIAVDNNSGRVSYLLSRLAQVRVTELVSHSLRIDDTRVVQLSDTTLTGLSPGRAEVQVLSPITGRVIGQREIRVGSDKVWVTRLHAAVISGLTLSLQPDSQLPDGFTAITAVSPILTAKYQEGLIDVWVELSEGSVLPLRQLDPTHYNLRVQSLDPNVVAVAPSPRSAQPRVIAIGSGHGDLIQVYLEVAEECERRRTVLSSTMVYVKVELENSNSDITEQSPSVPITSSRESMSPNSISSRHNAKKSKEQQGEKISSAEDIPHADAAASSYDHFTAGGTVIKIPGNRSAKSSSVSGIFLYVFVPIVCLITLGFAVLLVMYKYQGYLISKNTPPPSPSSTNNEEELSTSDTNAPDWVWLGSATLERASGIAQPANNVSSGYINLNDMNGNSPQQRSLENSGTNWQGQSRVCGTSGEINLENPVNGPVRNNETEPLLTSTPNEIVFSRDSKNNRRVTFNNLNQATPNRRVPPRRPPPPRRRNMDINPQLPSDSDDPPPVPPHGINVIANPLSNSNNLSTNETNADKPTDVFKPPKFVEVNADDFVRLRGVTRSRAGQIRRATILENPLLSTNGGGVTTTEMDDQNSSYIPPNHMMDYEQLVSYFSGLKESDA